MQYRKTHPLFQIAGEFFYTIIFSPFKITEMVQQRNGPWDPKEMMFASRVMLPSATIKDAVAGLTNYKIYERFDP